MSGARIHQPRAGLSSFFGAWAAKAPFLVDFWSPGNVIEKSIFFDFPQNREKWRISRPWAPRGFIFSDFPRLLGAILASFFRLFSKRRYFTKTYKNQWFFIIFTSPALSFFHSFLINFSTFARGRLPDSIFGAKITKLCQKTSFLVPPRNFNGPGIHLWGAIVMEKWWRKVQFFPGGLRWRASWRRICDPQLHKSTLDRILFDFGWILEQFLLVSHASSHDFAWFSNHFLYQILSDLHNASETLSKKKRTRQQANRLTRPSS